MMLRMRQICLVARQLAPVVEAFEDVFGLRVCYRDPAVAQYGLQNALFPIGRQFLEVVAPVTDGTAAGRFLDRRGGDGGYMVITQVDDLEARRRRCAALGVRVAHEIRHDEYHELQLHPRDVGAAMLSFSHQVPGGADADPWHPAGPGATSSPSRVVEAMVAARAAGRRPRRPRRTLERGHGAPARPRCGRPPRHRARRRHAPVRSVARWAGRGAGWTRPELQRPVRHAGAGEGARPGDARGRHGGDLRSAPPLLTSARRGPPGWRGGALGRSPHGQPQSGSPSPRR